jgi:lactate permease
VARALAPYGVLVLLVLATRAVPPLADALGSVAIAWDWQERFSGRVLPLTHPGTLLFLALLAGTRLQGAALGSVAGVLGHAARRLVPVTLALLAMLCLSRLMLHGGLLEALQRAAVSGVGSAWPLLAPAVGALGSFVTGSATASNVLFTPLQAQTAQSLGISTPWVVAAQGFGAAVGNIVCPHNIVAGAATVQATGREAEVLRRTLLPCLVHLLLGGAALALILLLLPGVAG